MNYFIIVFAVIFITMAFTVMIHPGIIKRKVFFEKRWLWPISILRVALGIGFLFSAEKSSAPTLILTFGVVVIVAGIVAPIIGSERLKTFADWWMNQNEFFIRIFGFFALLLGIGIALAGLPS